MSNDDFECAEVDVDELDAFNDRVGSGNMGGGTRGRHASEVPTEEGEENVNMAKDARMWAVQGANFFPCDESVKELAPAQYEVCHSPNSGFFFQQKNACFDELMQLPDSASEDIYKNLETFWTKEERFRSFGFLWKRGILLWGPAGSGKTCTLQLISQSIIKKGGISVYVNNPTITAGGLSIFRRIEPDRPCVVMLEDLDAMISTHGEHEVLALLDGELQIDNVVFIATTNYPERLDKRIVNRPSRFDIVKLIGMPKPAARKMYLSAKNKRLLKHPEELALWVKETEHFSIAHLKEVIVSVEVFEVPLEQAIKRLRKMIDSPPKSTDAERSPGQYN
jgi:SpoVK/Ycf46/Vps4 family AAA+-type ATPase